MPVESSVNVAVLSLSPLSVAVTVAAVEPFMSEVLSQKETIVRLSLAIVRSTEEVYAALLAESIKSTLLFVAASSLGKSAALFKASLSLALNSVSAAVNS